eukprot:206250_1
MSQCSVFHQGVIQLHLYLNAIDYLTHKQHHYSSANAVASPGSTEAYIAGMIRNKLTKYHESTHLLAMINHIHSPLIPSAKSEIKIGSHTKRYVFIAKCTWAYYLLLGAWGECSCVSACVRIST